MNSRNKVYLIGLIAQDLELKSFDNDKRYYIQFLLAIDSCNKFTGEKMTNFITVVAFDKKAKLICEYFSKGSPISIEGYIQIGNYVNKNKSKYYSTKIILESFRFIEKEESL